MNVAEIFDWLLRLAAESILEAQEEVAEQDPALKLLMSIAGPREQRLAKIQITPQAQFISILTYLEMLRLLGSHDAIVERLQAQMAAKGEAAKTNSDFTEFMKGLGL